MKCKICNKTTKKIFTAKILNKYNIAYFSCPNCKFMQTEEPYWLEESYKDSIAISDTGYMQRNIILSKKISVLLDTAFSTDTMFLDYAGGYGVFVRLMRDIGFDFYWDDKYTSNLFAKGFGFKNQKIGAITTFESFEHFVNPIDEIKKMLSISKNIIFTTTLLPKPIPKPQDWWYYGLNHGQHISFYSKETLDFIAKKHKLFYFYLDDIHIFTEKNLQEDFKLFVEKIELYQSYKSKVKSKTYEDSLNLSSLYKNGV